MPKKGYKQSGEHREKIRESRINYMNSLNEEERKGRIEKIRKTAQETWISSSDDFRQKRLKGLFKTHKKSDEHKRRISEGIKKRYSSMSEEEKLERNKILAKNGLGPQRTKETWPEKAFEKLLQEKGLIEHVSYEKQYQVDTYHVDFFLIEQNMIVEIYGCYPHCCKLCGHDDKAYGISANHVRENDKKKIEFIKSKGFNTKIIWEHQLPKKGQ